MTRIHRSLHLALLLATTYVASKSTNVKADAYCDGYLDGCHQTLLASCDGTISSGCSDTDHSNKHCDCTS